MAYCGLALNSHSQGGAIDGAVNPAETDAVAERGDR